GTSCAMPRGLLWTRGPGAVSMAVELPRGVFTGESVFYGRGFASAFNGLPRPPPGTWTSRPSGVPPAQPPTTAAAGAVLAPRIFAGRRRRRSRGGGYGGDPRAEKEATGEDCWPASTVHDAAAGAWGEQRRAGPGAGTPRAGEDGWGEACRGVPAS